MSQWIFELPGVTFERSWSIGNAVFSSPGTVEMDVASRASQRNVHKSWEAAHEVATEVAKRWSESSTVAVHAADHPEAELNIDESMAVLRFLMREVVTANVDIHRIGLVGETDRAIREYLLFHGERVQPAGL